MSTGWHFRKNTAIVHDKVSPGADEKLGESAAERKRVLLVLVPSPHGQANFCHASGVRVGKVRVV